MTELMWLSSALIEAIRMFLRALFGPRHDWDDDPLATPLWSPEARADFGHEPRSFWSAA